MIRGATATDPEPDGKGVAAVAMIAPHQFGVGQYTRDTLRLLNGQQPQRVAHQCRDADAFAAQAVQEQREGEQSEECFRLAATG